MKTFDEAVQFIKEFIIECPENSGCGRCDDLRKALEIIENEKK